MPELPEVETIVRELDAQLPGQQIEAVQVFRNTPLGRTSTTVFSQKLVGKKITSVKRRGKFILFHLAPSGLLVGHLRMTGKFILAQAPKNPGKHHRVWFKLKGGSTLIYEDLRCLGTLEVLDNQAQSASLNRLGVEPLSPEFTAAWLKQALKNNRTPLKHWLMNQGNIAGLGNIYVSEILFRARLSPLKPAEKVRSKQAEGIHLHTLEVLKAALISNGTTISDFRRVDDKTGEFQNFLQVYGKEGSPCTACTKPIQRIVQQQRSTFYCPSCQK